jgi:orotidine-5'-phosphate decarboxylase
MIIVPLDFPQASSALAMADRLDPALCRVKVGKELFTSAGPDVVRALHERGFEVFLDLKFHDIPSTVAGAVRAAGRLGVWMVNVHASGGSAMLEAARDAASTAARPPLLIAVTVLTSLKDEDMPAIGWQPSAAAQAITLARLACNCGLDGVVASAHEVRAIKAATRPDFLAVTPGIRAPEDDVGDQARVMTPQNAQAEGADYLVIGRPITQSDNPALRLASLHATLAQRP